MNRPSRCYAVLALVVCLGAIAPAKANLRAPIWKAAPPSAALKSAGPDLVVESEHLSLKLGSPYSGNYNPAWKSLREAEIEAVYRMRVPASEAGRATSPVVFEFVMARTPSAVEALVNGQAVPVMQPTLIPTEPGKVRQPDDDSVSVHFESVLRAGANEVRVRYRQPVSMYETQHGYITRSAWASAVVYELWPLREWSLAPDFLLQIEVSFVDDTSGLRRAVMGSDYSLGVLGFEGIDETADYFCYRVGGERCTPGRDLGGATTYAEGISSRRFELGAQFPARLVAIVRER